MWNRRGSTIFYFALLLLLILFLSGCEAGVLQFEVKNQLDQPLVVTYRHYDPSKGEWTTETRGPDDDKPWWSWPVNWREPLDLKDRYHFEARTVDGEMICSWKFAHDQIEGTTVILVVPSCESHEEGKPWKSLFERIFNR